MATTGPQLAIRGLELADEVAVWLAGKGFGAVGTEIFTFTLPDQPLQAILVRTDGGARDANLPLMAPHLQVQVRSKLPREGAVIAARLFEAFERQQVVTPSFIGLARADFYPGQYFRDANQHPVHPLGVTFTGKLRRRP